MPVTTNEVVNLPGLTKTQIAKLAKVPRVKMTTGEDGAKSITLAEDKPDIARQLEAFCSCFGSADHLFTDILLNQTANILSAKPGEETVNAVLATMYGIGPRDEVEGLLATQMTACHHTAMEMLKRANLPEQPTEVVDRCVNRASRLLNAFGQALDKLEQHRGRTHQKIVVERVEIQAGGQAIVGAVDASRRGEG